MSSVQQQQPAYASVVRQGIVAEEQQQQQIERLRAAVDQPSVVLPRLTTAHLGPDDLPQLADALASSDGGAP